MVLSTPDHVIEWYDCLMVLILINITTYLPFELHHSFLWAMRVWYEVVLRKWRTDLLWWRSGLLRFGPFISFYFLESRDAILMTFAVAYMLLNLVANSTPMVWTVYLTRNASTEHPILSLFITERRYIYILEYCITNSLNRQTSLFYFFLFVCLKDKDIQRKKCNS